MTRRKNPCLAAAIHELRSAGVDNFDVIQGRKHIKLRWPGGRMVTLSLSPSDRRAAKGARSDVRRLLRRDGVL